MEIPFDLLRSVRKPARYIGQEWNQCVTSPSPEVRLVLAYPDVYEIGMSNLGFAVLYQIVNALPFAAAERVYAPWPDMEVELRNAGLPLFSLETKTPLAEFDVIGFTLQHEMNYTNILTMLDVAGLPLRSADRDVSLPLVIGGGPCVYNPAPLSPFIDAFAIGEGEDLITELMTTVRAWKSSKASKDELLDALADISGIYVPARHTEKDSITRRIADLDQFDPPTKVLVPNTGVVHDRYAVEVMRGCTRGCRFCQAGMIYRPVRERSPEAVIKAAHAGLDATGYNEVSLVSLSSTDYSCIAPVVKELVPAMQQRGVSVSLPSLRIDAFSVDVAKDIGKSRGSSLTFAPEAGTQRMRDVINKGVTEDDLIRTAQTAFEQGFTKLKLYFMIGLPGETTEDLDGIIDLAYKVRELALTTVPRKDHRRVTITVNVASFIPKPLTPFQWAGQESLDSLDEKVDYLKIRLRKSYLDFKWHETKMAKIEAALALGGPKMADALEAAWRNGCRFDSWDDHFKYDVWDQAFRDADVDVLNTTDREKDIAETLPWDMIDTGVSKSFLAGEYTKARGGELTPDCRSGDCAGCGILCTR